MKNSIVKVGILLSFLTYSFLFSQSKGGRWQFENNGYDTANWDAVENNGELQGQASYSNTAPLVEGTYYLWLDSSNVHDYFKVEDSNDLDFDNENIGISAWIYPLVVGDDVHWIVNKGDQYTNPKTTNYALRISKKKKLEFLIRDKNNSAQSVASTFNIPTNQWTFVAVFYDYGAGKVYMWNDSSQVPVDTLDFHQEYFSNDAPLAIGSWYSSDPSSPSAKDFEGRIDDVRIGTTIDQILPSATKVIERNRVSSPHYFYLKQNYPNPFNNQTVIKFGLARDVHVCLDIYDLLGQKVKKIIDQDMRAGNYSFSVNTENLSSGIYFYHLQAGNFSSTGKMTLLK